MKKLSAFLLFLSCFFGAFGQKITQINLESSEMIRMVDKQVGRALNPVFEHQGSHLRADSADYNSVMNTFVAYGHVVINQPNGTTIFSDLLNYDGNTRIAVLTNNVKMIDTEGAILTTPLLTYDMGLRNGKYTTGGRIDNKGDVLTSRIGYYFDETSDAYFKRDVVITTKDAVVKADTMRYNSKSRIAYFDGPTHIYSKADTFYTEKGDYNTVTRQSHGVKNNLYQQKSRTLRGDALFYDDVKGTGKATGNVIFADTGEQPIILFGQEGLYSRADSSALMTKDPYVVFAVRDSSTSDSVYMTADSIYSRLVERRRIKPVHISQLILDAGNALTEKSDSEVLAALQRTKAAIAKTAVAKPAPVKKPKKKKGKKDAEIAPPAIDADSVANTVSLDSMKKGFVLRRPKTKAQIADSLRRDSLIQDSVKLSKDSTRTREVRAYRNVKIYKSDLQSTSDSVYYSYQDSVIRIYKDPVIWAQGAQMTSDTIYIQMKDNKLDKLLLQRNGFIANTESDSVNFNQVKGRTLVGHFVDSKLRRMYVNGNAESISFAKDSTGYVGMNHSEGSVMRISFDNNRVSQIAEIHLQNSIYSPYKEVKAKTLEGFNWRPADRPQSKEQIIPSLKAGSPAAADKNAPAVKPPKTAQPAQQKQKPVVPPGQAKRQASSNPAAPPVKKP